MVWVAYLRNMLSFSLLAVEFFELQRFLKLVTLDSLRGQASKLEYFDHIIRNGKFTFCSW